jgi:hypothetical protein
MLVALLLLALGTAALAVWALLLALVGRSTFPARERLPLRRWSWADLRANAVRGTSALSSVEAGVHHPLR